MARPKGSTNSAKAAQGAGAKTGPEAIGKNKGTPGDANEDNADNPEVEEIEKPKAAGKKSSRKVSESRASSGTNSGATTPLYYKRKLERFSGSIEDKQKVFADWTKDIVKDRTFGMGNVHTVLGVILKELNKKDVQNTKIVLKFILDATDQKRFYDSDKYRPSTMDVLNKLPGALLNQNPAVAESMSMVLQRIFEMLSMAEENEFQEIFLNEVSKTTSKKILQEVLSVVLSGKLDMTSDTAITQVQTILSKAEKLCNLTPSDALNKYGKNLDERIKRIFLNTDASSQQTSQNEVSSHESSSRASREQSSDDDNDDSGSQSPKQSPDDDDDDDSGPQSPKQSPDDDDDDDDSGSQSPDQSSHAQPLTPPHQRSPPHSQGKSAKTQANCLSRTSTSAPAAHVIEHHGDTPPPPSASMEASSSTGIPVLLHNEPDVSGLQYQSRKRRRPTNFASNKKPQNKNSRVSSRMAQTTATSAPYARQIRSPPRPTERPRIEDILALVGDRPIFFGPIKFYINYCGHGDLESLESRSSAPTGNNQELVDREIDADDGDGYDDDGYDGDERDGDGYDGDGYDGDGYDGDGYDGDGYGNDKH